MSLKGESDGLHGDLARTAAQLREGRPALAAFLQHLPVLETPDVGHRLLRHALEPSGWTVRMLYILERRPTYSRILAGKVSSPSLPSWPITSMGLARAAERAQVPLRVLGLAGHVKEGGAVQVRLGHGVERVLQLEDLHHHGVGVREEPHLREEPPHVEVVGLLRHELGELQCAGADDVAHRVVVGPRKDRDEVEVLRGSLHRVVRVLAAQLHLRLQETVFLPGRSDGGHVLPRVGQQVDLRARAGYLRHSFIAGFPTERVPKMPLSGVSARSGRPGSVHLQGARRHDDGCVHPADSLSAGDALWHRCLRA